MPAHRTRSMHAHARVHAGWDVVLLDVLRDLYCSSHFFSSSGAGCLSFLLLHRSSSSVAPSFGAYCPFFVVASQQLKCCPEDGFDTLEASISVNRRDSDKLDSDSDEDDYESDGEPD